MLCSVFNFIVIALFVVPSFATEYTHGENGKPVRICSDLSTYKAGDDFFKCFDIYVQNGVKHTNRSCVTSLPATLFNYVHIANESCYNDTTSFERDSLEFWKLLQFSLKNDKYKDFVTTGGLECIKGIKGKLIKCATNAVGPVNGAFNKYHTLWQKTQLIINEKSCRETYRIKVCTLNEIRNEGLVPFTAKCHWDSANLLFVSSLFDFMLERCNRLAPKWDDNRWELIKDRPIQGVKDDGSTTHILLGLLVTLVLLGILYITIRDCRPFSGRPRWKIFS